jgi:hypothetical protein
MIENLPISKLSNFTWALDGWVENLEEQYKTILPAMDRPASMDDFTVNRIYEVIEQQKDDLPKWQNQLVKWQEINNLSEEQQIEIKRLKKRTIEIKRLIKSILEMADKLKDETIESILNKDDGELAMDFLMGKIKP